MSAGPFVFGTYLTPESFTVACKVQPESEALTIGGQRNVFQNDTPIAIGTVPLNTGARRKGPFSARSVTLKFTDTIPAGYSANSRPRVPIFTTTLFNQISKGATGTYLGAAVEVVGVSAHKRN